VKTVPVGSGPDGVAFPRGGDFGYVTNELDHSISVIDTDTYMVTTIILPVGSIPDGVAFTANGKFAYVTNENDPGSMWVIDTHTNTIVDTITANVRSLPSGIAISRKKEDRRGEGD
jgi:YVTN family beta-propeller protein